MRSPRTSANRIRCMCARSRRIQCCRTRIRRFPSPRSPRIAIRRSRGTVRRTPPTGVRSACTDGRPLGWHGCFRSFVTLHVVLSSGRCAAGPDGRGAAQAAWPVGPVPGPPSAAAPAGRHADACDAPDVRSCCVPAGRAGSRLRWRDPFSTCSRRMAGRGGGSASPSGRAPFSAATRIRLDRDS